MSCSGKQEPGCVPITSSGITSINGDSTPSQTIVGSGIGVTTSGGVTTITGGTGGSVTAMNAPQVFVSPVNITGTTLNLQYSGQPLQLTFNANYSQVDQRQNYNTGSLAETGYQSLNDTGDMFSMVIGGSGNSVKPDGTITNARRGIIRNASTAFGIDIDQQGTGKLIRLMTNNLPRFVVGDYSISMPTGDFNIVIGTISVELGSIDVLQGNISVAVGGITVTAGAITAFDVIAVANVSAATGTIAGVLTAGTVSAPIIESTTIGNIGLITTGTLTVIGLLTAGALTVTTIETPSVNTILLTVTGAAEFTGLSNFVGIVTTEAEVNMGGLLTCEGEVNITGFIFFYIVNSRTHHC